MWRRRRICAYRSKVRKASILVGGVELGVEINAYVAGNGNLLFNVRQNEQVTKKSTCTSEGSKNPKREMSCRST